MAFYPKQHGTANNTFDIGLNRITAVWNLTAGSDQAIVGVGNLSSLISSSGISSQIGTELIRNAYWDGSIWKYRGNGNATRYFQGGGAHQFLTAANNTSGANATVSAWTAQMTIDSAGNVGIGTTTPSSKLHTLSTTTAVSILETSGTGTNDYADQQVVSPTVLGRTTAYGANHPSRPNSMWVGTQTAHPLILATSGVARILADTSGNIGIGASAPAWGLGQAITIGTSTSGGSASFQGDNGGSRITQGAFYNGTNWVRSGNNGSSIYTQSGGSHLWSNAVAGTIGTTFTPAESMRIDVSGNVGIGTTTPSSFGKFAVVGGSFDFFVNPGEGSASTAIGSRGNVPLTWYINNAERARLLTSGNLLINATVPPFSGNAAVGVVALGTTNLDSGVQAVLPSGAATSQAAYVSQSVSTAGGWYHFIGQYGNGTSITTNAVFIAANGNITNVNNSYGAISDVNLKENIVDATPKLEDVNKVRVVNYTLKNDETKTKQLGVIAQELEQIFPGMIETAIHPGSEQEIKSVKYSVFVPILIKAVQELSQRVEELETKLRDLS